MREIPFDTAVIGGGAAGMAAALEVRARGHRVCIVERDDELGGILLQCIHNGFGLHEFREDLTGPEYAGRAIREVAESEITIFTRTTVSEIASHGGGHELTCYSAENGVVKIASRAIVLAMGCRERNRGNLRIPGSRPAGVFTAGLAQRLINMEGREQGARAGAARAGGIRQGAGRRERSCHPRLRGAGNQGAIHQGYHPDSSQWLPPPEEAPGIGRV